MASVFPSGSSPDQCRNGHPWHPYSGNMLVGSTNCDCRNAVANHYVHMWIKCRGDKDACDLTWWDPPCSYLQHTEPPPPA